MNRRRTRDRLLWIAAGTGLSLSCILLPAGPAAADDARQTSTLDDELLRGLDRELLEDLSPQTISPPTDPLPAESRREPAAVRDAGEDVGQPSDPLERIARRMQTVERRIGQHDTATDTQQMQLSIVEDLADLIEQMKKQSAGGDPSSQQRPSSQTAQDNPQAGNVAARESSNRLGQPAEYQEEDLPDTEGVIREVWGHLPDRVREQMRHAPVDRFLPQYEALIEAYYRRLAEESD